MDDGRFEQRIPGDLSIVMGVNVCKTRRDDGPASVDEAMGTFRANADVDDAAVTNTHIPDKAFFACAVANGSTNDLDVVHGGDHRRRRGGWQAQKREGFNDRE